MVDLAPFRGLRYGEDVPLSEVTAPPYDAIDDDLAAELRRRHPHNVVRLERGAGTGRTADGSGPQAPYRRVAATYRRWLDDGVLRRDPQPCLYVYEQAYVERGRPRRQRGLFAALALRAWDAGEVLPHERIHRPPVEDRLRLLRVLPANTSAVFALAHREPRPVARALERVMRGPEIVAFRDPAGVEHRLWPVADPAFHEVIASGYDDVPLLMADGHHRYTTALEYHAEHPDETGADRILAYVVGGDGPVVRPSHRLVRARVDDIEHRLGAAGLSVEPLGTSDGARPHAGADAPIEQALAGMRAAGGPAYTLLTPDPSDDRVRVSLVTVEDRERIERLRDAADADPAVRDLDVTLLHGVLSAVLGVEDGAAGISVTSDEARAARAVRHGRAGAAFLVRPVTVAQVWQVAEDGGRMPPKATSFHPKPRTGLVIRPLGG